MKTEEPVYERIFVPQRPPEAAARIRKDTKLIILGVLCICLGALGSAWAWALGHETRQVVIVTRDIPRGEEISGDDLGMTTISASSQVASIDISERESLIGQHAMTDLKQGALLAPAMVGADSLPRGESRLGLRLPVGRVPAHSLAPGDEVILIEVVSGTNTPGAEYQATIASTPELTIDQGSYLVDVQVSEENVGEIAVLGAQDMLVLARSGGK